MNPSVSTTEPGNTSFPTGKEGEIFNTINTSATVNDPANSASFSISETYKITLIKTYHWNGGSGSSPVSIGLMDSSGNTIGTWNATVCSGSGEVPNTYWEVKPDIILSPGTYTIIDSDTSTWSCNSESGNRGMAVVYGDITSDIAADPGNNTSSTGTNVQNLTPPSDLEEVIRQLEAALKSGDVEKVLTMVEPMDREKYNSIFKSHPEALSSIGAMIATRKLVFMGDSYAEFLVTEKESSYPMIFEKIDAAWCLSDF